MAQLLDAELRKVRGQAVGGFVAAAVKKSRKQCAGVQA